MKRPLLSLPVRVSLYALCAVLLYRWLSAQPRLGRMPTAVEALGDLSRLPAASHAALEADPASFQPLEKPGGSDWLAHHPEPGQTFAEYQSQLTSFKPAPGRKAICVLPIGTFGADSPSLEHLRQLTAVFFGMEARLLPAVPLEKVPAKQRVNPGTKKRQLLTTDILRWLPGIKPADAYALIAVTMEDLYPEESWNFVFGQALLQGGAGVFSFARYDPAFYGDARDAGTRDLAFLRSCKVLCHETGHMFGLRHCVFYQCLMNGSNHLEETDRHPLHLCPVCLRKLQLGAGFDLRAREAGLADFYKARGMKAEADWTARRLEKITATGR